MLILIIILILTACAGYCAINSDKRTVKVNKPVVKVNVIKPKAKKPVVNNITKPSAKKVTKKVVAKKVAKKATKKVTKKNSK